MYFQDRTGAYSTGMGTINDTLEGYVNEGAIKLLTEVGVGFNCDSSGKPRNPSLAFFLDTLQEGGMLTYATYPTTVYKQGKPEETWQGRFWPTKELIDTCKYSTPSIEEFCEKYDMEKPYFVGGGTPSLVYEDGEERPATLKDLEYIMKGAEANGIPLMCMPLKPTLDTRQTKGMSKEQKRKKMVITEELEPYRAMAENYNGVQVWEPSDELGRRQALEYSSQGKNILLSAAPEYGMHISDDGFNKMLEAVDTGLDFFCPSMLTGGVDAPATPFGMAEQAVAEIYVGLIFTQLQKPGTGFLAGPYANISSTRAERSFEMGAPALTMTNYIIGRTLTREGIPNIPSAATSNENGFNAEAKGLFTNKDVEVAMEWIYGQDGVFGFRHGLPGCIRDQKCVNLDLFDMNLKYLQHLKSLGLQQKHNELPLYLMNTRVEDVKSAANNGGQLTDTPESLLDRHLEIARKGVEIHLGNYSGMDETLDNLPALNSLFWLDFSSQ